MNHYFTGESMDEIFLKILDELGRNGEEVKPRGKLIKEIRHCSFELTNPRKRVIFNPVRKFSMFYALGELAWYLAGSNDVEFIKYYSSVWAKLSDDGQTLNSAYGYRIFKDKHPLIPFNQWENVKRQLQEDPDTRQAIVHLHTPNDKPTKDEVCTLCLQFFIRNGKLELMTTMRSNDITWGTAYDVFCFTMLQEKMAYELGIDVGSYYHYAGSMHIYEKDFGILETAFNFENIGNGWGQDRSEMAALDFTNENMDKFLKFEKYIRVRRAIDVYATEYDIRCELPESWAILTKMFVGQKLLKSYPGFEYKAFCNRMQDTIYYDLLKMKIKEE